MFSSKGRAIWRMATISDGLLLLLLLLLSQQFYGGVGLHGLTAAAIAYPTHRTGIQIIYADRQF